MKERQPLLAFPMNQYSSSDTCSGKPVRKSKPRSVYCTDTACFRTARLGGGVDCCSTKLPIWKKTGGCCKIQAQYSPSGSPNSQRCRAGFVAGAFLPGIKKTGLFGGGPAGVSKYRTKSGRIYFYSAQTVY